MSTGLKWVAALVVIIITGVVLWKSGLVSPGAPAAPSSEATTTQQTTQSGLPTSQSDTSDAATAQDTAAIDAQMQGLSQDQAGVDSSLNDQPVQQSY